MCEARQTVDEAAEVVAQVYGCDASGQRRFLPDRDLRQHPGELGRRQSAVLPLAGGEGLREGEAETLECTNVDEVADLRAAEQRAQLVGEYLLGGVDPNHSMRRLVRSHLLGSFEDEVDDDGLIAPRQEDPAELGRRPDVSPGRAELRGGFAQGAPRA